MRSLGSFCGRRAGSVGSAREGLWPGALRVALGSAPQRGSSSNCRGVLNENKVLEAKHHAVASEVSELVHEMGLQVPGLRGSLFPRPSAEVHHHTAGETSRIDARGAAPIS